MPRGTVATYTVPGHGFSHGHERATRDGIARRLAALKGLDFAGEYDPPVRPRGRSTSCRATP